MTTALVIYESIFGNTARIAEAVADGLAERVPVQVLEVTVAPVELTVDDWLLVVGGPTHAFGMSRPGTRRSAAEQSAARPDTAAVGVREWLHRVRPAAGFAAAAFDTRIARPRLPGAASRAIDRRLRRLGARMVVAPESFFVVGTPGPLLDGECQRAREWGALLAGRITVGGPAASAAERTG